MSKLVMIAMLIFGVCCHTAQAMSTAPAQRIVHYELSPRSQRALMELRVLLKRVDGMEAVRAVAPFTQLLRNPDQPHIALRGADWVQWTQTVAGLSEWQRQHLHGFCAHEAAGSRSNYRFWRRLAATFE